MDTVQSKIDTAERAAAALVAALQDLAGLDDSITARLVWQIAEPQLQSAAQVKQTIRLLANPLTQPME